MVLVGFGDNKASARHRLRGPFLLASLDHIKVVGDLSVDLVRIEISHFHPSGRFKILQLAQCGKGAMRYCKAAGGGRHPVEADQFLDHIEVFCHLQDGIAVGLDDVLPLGP